MRLSEICVQRPVFAFMLIMFLVVMGVFSFLDLGVDLFPRTDPATVYVQLPPARRQSGRGGFAGGHAAGRGHRFGQRHR